MSKLNNVTPTANFTQIFLSRPSVVSIKLMVLVKYSDTKPQNTPKMMTKGMRLA